MQMQQILEGIDDEITRLQQARAALADIDGSQVALRGKGRPKGSSNKKGVAVPAKKPKRTMTEEGKARIAAAQRARWASQKASKRVKAASKKAAPQAAKKAVKRAPNSTKRPAAPQKAVAVQDRSVGSTASEPTTADA